ncbi:MAG: hypothetical protein IIZ93_01770 [Acidaminococcaceae bacterium]|nr:hypothetical protein [Acidaminococcaceae bacterium]
MKVWVVTYGSYSDFTIDSIFSTEEKAKKYIEKMKYFDNDINDEPEEYEVDDPAVMKKNYVKLEYYPGSDDLKKSHIPEEFPVGESIAFENGKLVYTFSLPVDSRAFQDDYHDWKREQLKKAAQDRYAQFKARIAGI